MSIQSLRYATQILAIVTVVIFAFSDVANAEPLSLDSENNSATLIEFKAEQKLGDFVGRIEGSVDNTGKRFFIKNLDVMSPTVITVLSKDPSKPIDVSLHRYFWQEADLEGVTSASEGYWGYAGRIHDEVGIALSASEAAEFYILAWMGPRIDSVAPTSLFIPADNSSGSSGSDVTGVPVWALAAIIALLVVIVGLLFRNRRPANTAVIALLLAPVMLLPAKGVDAQAPDESGPFEFDRSGSFESRLNSAESMVEALHGQTYALGQWADRRNRQSRERMEQINESLGDTNDEAQEGIQRVQDELRNVETSLSARLDTLNSLIELVNDSAQWGVDQVALELREALSTAAELRDSMQNQLLVNDDLYRHIENLYMLVDQDRAAIPDRTYGGVGPMPSNCINDSACRSCFDAANEKLVIRLEQYEKLRVIYSSQRTLTEYAVMTGDAMSGYHQLEQAAWYGVKLLITKAQMEVTKAYNAKYEEFNGKLDGILREFGQCEAIHGDDYWYESHGKLFYNSLINGYRVYDNADGLLW